MSIQRYIVTYSIVAFIIVGFVAVMHKASQFDYRYVNRCSAAGGEARNIGDIWSCTKNGTLLLIGDE